MWGSYLQSSAPQQTNFSQPFASDGLSVEEQVSEAKLRAQMYADSVRVAKERESKTIQALEAEKNKWIESYEKKSILVNQLEKELASAVDMIDTQRQSQSIHALGGATAAILSDDAIHEDLKKVLSSSALRRSTHDQSNITRMSSDPNVMWNDVVNQHKGQFQAAQSELSNALRENKLLAEQKAELQRKIDALIDDNEQFRLARDDLAAKLHFRMNQVSDFEHEKLRQKNEMKALQVRIEELETTAYSRDMTSRALKSENEGYVQDIKRLEEQLKDPSRESYAKELQSNVVALQQQVKILHAKIASADESHSSELQQLKTIIQSLQVRLRRSSPQLTTEIPSLNHRIGIPTSSASELMSPIVRNDQSYAPSVCSDGVPEVPFTGAGSFVQAADTSSVPSTSTCRSNAPPPGIPNAPYTPVIHPPQVSAEEVAGFDDKHQKPNAAEAPEQTRGLLRPHFINHESDPDQADGRIATPQLVADRPVPLQPHVSGKYSPLPDATYSQQPDDGSDCNDSEPELELRLSKSNKIKSLGSKKRSQSTSRPVKIGSSESKKVATPKTATPKTATPKTAAPKTATPKTATPKASDHSRRAASPHSSRAVRDVREREEKRSHSLPRQLAPTTPVLYHSASRESPHGVTQEGENFLAYTAAEHKQYGLSTMLVNGKEKRMLQVVLPSSHSPVEVDRKTKQRPVMHVTPGYIPVEHPDQSLVSLSTTESHRRVPSAVRNAFAHSDSSKRNLSFSAYKSKVTNSPADIKKPTRAVESNSSLMRPTASSGGRRVVSP